MGRDNRGDSDLLKLRKARTRQDSFCFNAHLKKSVFEGVDSEMELKLSLLQPTKDRWEAFLLV
jgi:hypothetical protein